MKKLIAIFVLLAGGGGAAWWYFNYGKPKEKPQIVTAAVSRQNIVEVVQTTGALEAKRLVNVGSQVSGTVKSLFADYNSIVKEGMVIAEIDPALLQVQVEIATANIERARNDLAQQRVQLENDKKNLERIRTQKEAGLQSTQQFETAELQVKSREATIGSSEKGLLQQQASLNSAKLNVEYCTIKSPVNGVVIERKVDIGQAVQSSVNVAQFYTIATDITELKLTAGVDEAEIGKVRQGMPVLFTVESYGGREFSGKVDNVRMNATNTNGVVTYPVWISVPNNDLMLKPSMTATIRIIISTAEDALRIPSAALRFKPNMETWAALGIEAPGAGRGNVNAANGRNNGGGGANANTNPAAPPAAGNAAAAPPAGAPQPGAAPGGPQNGAPRNGQGDRMAQMNPQAPGGQTAMNGRGGNNNGGRGGNNGGRGGTPGTGGNNRNRGTTGPGFGTGGGMNSTPGQFPQMGRGNRNQNQPANAAGDMTPLSERGAKQIDELFPEPPKQILRGTVYTWDEATKQLTSHTVMTGITDGMFSELITGDVTVGQALVTNVILPIVNKPGQAPGSNIFGQPQGRGNPGGMTPGQGGGAGGRGGGATGGGGGGAGGRGGGGGGGGRGGN